ncbi:MAG: hypothetical protein JW932_01020 [Deltaproteobacteria bacterium]|nr:hypothetical protein [Deltaproteobacteria bacterium]
MKLNKDFFIPMICIIFLILTPLQAKAGDSRFTVTFAGATVIGGVYVLISWSVSDSYNHRISSIRHAALLNYDSKDWSIGMPDIKSIQFNNTHITPYVEVFKYRF